MTRNLLLISNSTNAGEEYLAWPLAHIVDFLQSHKVKNVLFVPFAGISLAPESLQLSYDRYEERVANIFKPFGINITSVHRKTNRAEAVNEHEAVMVGGGNTFHLVSCMHEYGLMEPIRRRIGQGMPFVGWSAGANVACPTMKTTNDMPICEPPSFTCLKVVPFQINPHYLDANPDGHAGETREQRIQEFLIVNRDMTVVGLREGCLLEVHGDQINLVGKRPLRIFRSGLDPLEIQPGGDLDFLLNMK
jgi:dipeptidase E